MYKYARTVIMFIRYSVQQYIYYVKTLGRNYIFTEGERQPANFIVLYSDDSEGPHCLTLSMYGQGRSVRESERWVLLEQIPRDEAERED